MKFSEYQRINESLDRPGNYKLVRELPNLNVYAFQVDGVYYEIDIQKSNIREPNGMQSMKAEVSFKALDGSGYQLTKKDDKTARIVLSTVVDAIFSFVREYNPAQILYSAFNDADPSDAAKRLRLYQIMTKAKLREFPEYDFRNVGRDFIVYDVNYQQRVEEFSRRARRPVGYEERSDHVEVNLSHANAFAFIRAFGVNDGDSKSGVLGKGRAFVGATNEIKARLRVDRVVYEMSDREGWLAALQHPIFDYGEGPEVDRTYLVGAFKNFYIVLTSQTSLKIYTDDAAFTKYVNAFDAPWLNPEIMES
ncbi:hypothetical protein [Vibrio phage TCU-VP03-AIR1]